MTHQFMTIAHVTAKRGIQVIHSAVAPHRAKTARNLLRKSLGVENDTPCLRIAAASLARSIGDLALRKRLGAAGPERVTKTYSPHVMVDAYERLHSELIRKGAKR